MSDHHRSRRLRTRLVLAVLSALALVGALFAAPSPATADSLPSPTSMTVTASNGPDLPTDLGGTVPGVLTAVNQEFEITVALWDGSTMMRTVLPDGADSFTGNDQQNCSFAGSRGGAPT